MSYKYTHFIKENTAPKGAKNIAVYKNGNKVCTVPLGRLKPTKKTKNYSFGLLSDVHIAKTTDDATNKLKTAMEFFKGKVIDFLCHCGDITNTGLWYPISETAHTSKYDEDEISKFYKTCKDYIDTKLIFGNAGNHESYNTYDVSNTSRLDIYGADPTLEINTLSKYQNFTGNGLVFTMTRETENGDDVFIFVGQSTQELPMDKKDETDHLQWLYERLEENRNKRCFVFVHSYVSYKDSGNPLQKHSLPLFDFWGATNTKAFIDMMKHYKNTILFHGHSHVHFLTQEQVSHAIYSTELGFRSVHVPSSANGRRLLDNGNGGYTLEGKNSAFSLGYYVEVYDNSIVLNGIDFINNEPVPIGTYEIDTTLVEIEEKTFTDSTGTIKT